MKTVKELIEELQKYPPQFRVQIEAFMHDDLEIDHVSRDKHEDDLVIINWTEKAFF